MTAQNEDSHAPPLSPAPGTASPGADGDIRLGTVAALNLFLVVLVVLVVLVTRYVRGEPWRVAVGGGVGVLAYLLFLFGVWRVRGRSAGWYEHPWYVFLLAGVAGALAYVAVTGADLVASLVSALIWATMHCVMAEIERRMMARAGSKG